MSLYWKITVWTNFAWLVFGILYQLANNNFGWLMFIYGAIGLGTIIKCLELAKEVEIKDKKIKELENKTN